MTECAVCKNPGMTTVQIAGLRRATCWQCLHCQRIDIQPFDYKNVTMGRSGASPERIASQIGFLERSIDKFGSVLEIGSANGALARALRAKHSLLRYDGIEFSPAGEEAKQVLNNLFDKPLTLLLNEVQIARSSYDLIIASHCLEHMHDLPKEIGAMKSALQFTGMLFLEVPNGSGHPRLPFDDNRSHLHFFTLNSLTHLLSSCALRVVQAETGAWYDARYPDSIRVLAQPFLSSTDCSKLMLSDHFLLSDVDRVIVWGAGGIAEELLAHFFDLSRIAFFVDRSKDKQGSTCLGLPVRAPESISECSAPVVLINSLEFEDSIRCQLQEQFPDKLRKVVSIAQLLK